MRVRTVFGGDVMVSSERGEPIEIFTDGSCSPNPGVGGWAALLRWQGREKMISGSCPETTNNRMELIAVVRALEILKCRTTVRLMTDSQYVQLGITSWMPAWKRRNFSKVKNRDLWDQLCHLAEQHDVTWIWIRGHNGHPENERVDLEAKNAVRRLAEKKGDP